MNGTPDPAYGYRKIIQVMEDQLIKIQSDGCRFDGTVDMLTFIHQLRDEFVKNENLDAASKWQAGLYRQIFDTNPFIIVLWGLDQKIVDCNSQAETVFGWRKNEMIGKSFVDLLVSPKDRDGIRGRILEFLGENFNRNTLSWNLTKTNEIVLCEWRHSVLYGQAGECETIVSVGLNINHRNAAEREAQELRRMMDALSRSVAEINGKLELNDLVDHIFGYIGRVISYESINLMLLEGEEVVFVQSREDDDLSVKNPMCQQKIKLHESVFFTQMLESGKPVISSRIFTISRLFDHSSIPGFRSFAGAPLIVRGKIIGFLVLASLTSGSYVEKDSEHLQPFATLIAIALENTRLVQKLRDDSITDELTGLYDRRGILMLGKSAFDRVKRRGGEFSILFIDIDHFKEINNVFGHDVGDKILQLFAEELSLSSRAYDFVGRSGGDQFVFLLLNCAQPDAILLAEKLRTEIEPHIFLVYNFNIRLTISVGLAQRDNLTIDFSDLWEQADIALYRAKQEGRNRVYYFENGVGD